jgi:hypothetical protein
MLNLMISHSEAGGAASHAAYFTPTLPIKALYLHNRAECEIDAYALHALMVPRTETTFVGRRRCKPDCCTFHRPSL